MTLQDFSAEIFARYGTVRRARGVYLYTAKGVRLTDCFLEGGAAILGWNSGKARTHFKDTFERGANGSFCGGLYSALETSVKHLLPAEYTCVRLVPSQAAAGNTCSLPDSARLWRPWLDFCRTDELNKADYPNGKMFWPCLEKGGELPPVVRIVPPFPFAGSPVVLAFTGDFAEKNQDRIPEHEVCPAPLISAITRSFYELKQALGEYGHKDFTVGSKVFSEWFELRECWLFPKISREDYDRFVLEALDAGIIFSPDYDTPSIMPWRANAGDFKRFSAARS